MSDIPPPESSRQAFEELESLRDELRETLAKLTALLECADQVKQNAFAGAEEKSPL